MNVRWAVESKSGKKVHFVGGKPTFYQQNNQWIFLITL